MDRRQFLARFGFGSVAAAAAMLSFDVERLLWIPGEKTIFIPTVTDEFLTIDWVTKEMLVLLKNDITFASYIDQSWKGTHSGSTVQVKPPKRCSAKSLLPRY